MPGRPFEAILEAVDGCVVGLDQRADLQLLGCRTGGDSDIDDQLLQRTPGHLLTLGRRAARQVAAIER